MSALFAHDHRFILRGGQVWSQGAFTADTFERYAAVFGPMKVAARVRELAPGEDVSRLTRVFDTRDPLVSLPNLSTLRNLIRPSADARATLRAAIAGTDLVIARLPSEIGLLALDEARRAGKPALVEVVGAALDALRSHGAPGSKLYAPLADWRMRRAVARASHVHYVSNAFLQQRYPTRGRSIGVSDVQIERPGPDVLERRLAGIAEDRPMIFGMLAALYIRQKGIDVAIRALARGRRTDPRLTLRIAGPGDPDPWRKVAADEGVGDAVEFVGLVPRGEGVLAWLDTIDVYVQASFQEGLPRALIEAMRQATPALASSAGGTPELLGAEWLHTPGDAARLAEQMLAVRPAAIRAEMARANFATSLDYDIALLTERRTRFWQAMLADFGLRAGQAITGTGSAHV